MRILERPIHFLGKPTGFTAQSARHASIIVHLWLCGAGPYDRSKNPHIPEPPVIDRRYCPALRTRPTVDRLYKNTALSPLKDHWIVGLGVPDRRRTYADDSHEIYRGMKEA